MKNRLLCGILLICIILCAGCGIFTGKSGTTQSGTALDYTDAEKTAVPSLSDSAYNTQEGVTPTPRPTVFEKKNVKIRCGKQATVNGYKVTLVQGSDENNDFVYAVCEDQTVFVSDGFFEKAYLCGRETGKTSLVVCVMNEERYETHIYRLNREKKKLFYETALEAAKLESITDATVTLSSNAELFGTWNGKRSFLLTEKSKLEPVDKWWIIESIDETRYLTALCDIRARKYDVEKQRDIKDTYVLEGSVLSVQYIDSDFDYAVLMDVQSKEYYKIYVESDGRGGYLIEDTGAEGACFDNIQYWG